MDAAILIRILKEYKPDTPIIAVVEGRSLATMKVSTALDNLLRLAKPGTDIIEGSFKVAGREPIILREAQSDTTLRIRTRTDVPKGHTEWLELECR